MLEYKHMVRSSTCSVLVVDDNAEQVNILKKILTREGYEVSSATSGADALKIVEDEPIDVLITDMSMPEMDGITLLKKAKAVKKNLPIIIITAFGEWGPYAEALREGAADFLSKPFKVDEILKVLRRVVQELPR